jgi:hypothetical protein
MAAVADPKNQAVLDRLGFVATPHFFLLKADGTPVAQMLGVVPRDSLVRARSTVRRQLTSGATPPAAST